MSNHKVTVEDIKALKGKRKFSLLTAYDYPFASVLDRSGIDIILVGDSLANVVLGLESTKEVGMTEMIYHTKAVRRAVKHALLVGDMPFEAYQKDVQNSVKNAQRFIEEAGCDAVKLEWFDQVLDVAAMIHKAGIPMMGHVGLTPQTADKLGGLKVQGKDAQAAKQLIERALQLQEAGCFSILIECVPDKVAEIITKKCSIPTIGIGAGPHCDGQALVTYDMVGLFDRYTPKFVKKYLNLTDDLTRAFEAFRKDVSDGKFPAQEHSFSINPEELKKLDTVN
jgi:3-methyl-2-oxobutanoate hydroxymethyltransferase